MSVQNLTASSTKTVRCAELGPANRSRANHKNFGEIFSLILPAQNYRLDFRPNCLTLMSVILDHFQVSNCHNMLGVTCKLFSFWLNGRKVLDKQTFAVVVVMVVVVIVIVVDVIVVVVVVVVIVVIVAV